MTALPVQTTVAMGNDFDARKKTRELMCPGQPSLAAFFSSNPIRLGFILGVGSVVLLMLPALIARVALIKDTQTQKWPWVGFWQRWNWSAMYVVILPLIFAGGSCTIAGIVENFRLPHNREVSGGQEERPEPCLKFR
jgi:hypothetical protein